MNENEDTVPAMSGEKNGGEQKGGMGKAYDNLLGDQSSEGIMGFFNFKTMYFPTFARILLVLFVGLYLLLGGALTIGGIVLVFTKGLFEGLPLLLVAALYVVVGSIATRICMELVMVIFKINEGVQDIREMLRAKLGEQ